MEAEGRGSRGKGGKGKEHAKKKNFKFPRNEEMSFFFRGGEGEAEEIILLFRRSFIF